MKHLFPFYYCIDSNLIFYFLYFSKLLISLTVQYFKSDESIGERSTCIVTGLIYLLVAMMILIVDENTLEIGLEQAYKSFNESASVYLEERGVSSSYVSFFFCMFIFCKQKFKKNYYFSGGPHQRLSLNFVLLYHVVF